MENYEKKVNSKVSPNYCKLWLTGKFFIIKPLDDCNLLNNRSGLVSKYRHQNKFARKNCYAMQKKTSMD